MQLSTISSNQGRLPEIHFCIWLCQSIMFWTLYIQLTATSQKELEDIKGVIRIVYRSEEQKTRRSKIMWGVNL
jgi:hypothetical protein